MLKKFKRYARGPGEETIEDYQDDGQATLHMDVVERHPSGKVKDPLNAVLVYLNYHGEHLLDLDELAVFMGYKAPQTVYGHLKALLDKGAISRVSRGTYVARQSRVNKSSKIDRSPKKAASKKQPKTGMGRSIDKVHQALAENEGKYISQRQISEAYGISKSRVSECISALVHSGIFSVEQDGHNRRYFKVDGGPNPARKEDSQAAKPVAGKQPRTVPEVEQLALEYMKTSRDQNLLGFLNWLEQKTN